MSKYPMICMWDGVQIEELSHSRLCEIVTELVKERDDSRSREYERQKHAFDYVKPWRTAR